MTPDQYLLASAYLDGELTDDERRLAEADPAVMAEVEELRALHVELADVGPPTAEARESAIAAAMAAFSPTATGSAAAAPVVATVKHPVVPFRPRPSYTKYLGVAAAVVAIGLLGTVIVTSNQGGDDDASSEAPAAADASVADRMMVESTDAPASEPAADAEIMMDDAAEESADDTTESASLADGDTATTDAPAEADVAGSAEPTDPSLPADDVLIVYAEDVLARRDAGTLGPTPNTECTVDDAPNAFILELADLPTQQGSAELFISIDETTGIVYGLDPDSCELLVDAPLP